MTSSATYRLQPMDMILNHGHGEADVLHDYIDDTSNMEIEALVASGDCFVTLASQLDEIAELMDSDPEVTRPQLEQIVRTLLYMQRFYKPVRKYPKH